MDASEIAYTIAHKDDGNSYYVADVIVIEETGADKESVFVLNAEQVTSKRYNIEGISVAGGELDDDYSTTVWKCCV